MKGQANRIVSARREIFDPKTFTVSELVETWLYDYVASLVWEVVWDTVGRRTYDQLWDQSNSVFLPPRKQNP